VVKCLVQLVGIRGARIAIPDMDGDPDRTLVRQFACPTDDVFFGFLIEILFPEWKRIEGVKQLHQPINADFDQVLRIFRHDVASPDLPLPCMRHFAGL
jgi:hypothetical protein